MIISLLSLHEEGLLQTTFASHENYYHCVSFNVMTSRSITDDGNLTHLLGERSKVPDHSAIIVEFRTLHESLNRHNDPTNNRNSHGQKCYKLKSIPNDFITSDLSKLALQTIITRIESARETQGEIDAIYETLCYVIVTEMNNSVPAFDISKR